MKMFIETKERLSRATAVAYSLGSFGTGVFSTVPTVLLLYYATEVVNIAPLQAGLVVFAPKVWGIFIDPVIGAWSDQTRSALGRRGPFLLAGTVCLPLSFVLLFHTSVAGLEALTLAAAYLLLVTAYSVFAVPYLAIPAEISPHATDRERLLSWRIAFAMAGVLLGAGAAPHLIAWGGGGQAGYRFMSWILGSVCGLGMLSAFLSTRRFDEYGFHLAATRMRGLASVLMHKTFARLALAYVMQLSAAGVISAATPYFVAHVLGRSAEDAGTALGAVLIVTIAAIPLWAWLLQRIGPWRALVTASLWYGATCVGISQIPNGASLGAVIAVFALAGVPFAGLQLVPFTLLAHLASAEGGRNADERHEGLYTGVWTAGEKLGLALGPGAAALGLAASGFVSGSGSQTAETLENLRLLLSFGPMLFLVIGVGLLWPELKRANLGRHR